MPRCIEATGGNVQQLRETKQSVESHQQQTVPDRSMRVVVQGVDGVPVRKYYSYVVKGYRGLLLYSTIHTCSGCHKTWQNLQSVVGFIVKGRAVVGWLCRPVVETACASAAGWLGGWLALQALPSKHSNFSATATQCVLQSLTTDTLIVIMMMLGREAVHLNMGLVVLSLVLASHAGDTPDGHTSDQPRPDAHAPCFNCEIYNMMHQDQGYQDRQVNDPSVLTISLIYIIVLLTLSYFRRSGS